MSKKAIKLFKQGNIHLTKNEFDRAIEAYTQAIALNPDFAEAFNHRGMAYGNKGEFDRAIPDFNQAIALNPKNANALFGQSGGLVCSDSRYPRYCV